MIALAVVMMRVDPDVVPAARGPGLSARRGHHAGCGEPRPHRRRVAARHRLFHEAAGGRAASRSSTASACSTARTRTTPATFFVGFKSFDERYKSANIRTQNARAVLVDAYEHLSQVKEGIILPVNPPSIPGLGTTGGTEMWIQSKGDATIAQLAGVVNEFLAKAKQRPELARVTSTFNASSQQLLVNVDRDKAETLGVPVEDVYSAMQTMFGSLYVSQFNRSSRLWQVILQAEPSYRLKPEDLDQIFVRSKTGSMVPLKSVVTTQVRHRPGPGHALQQFPGGQDHGQRRAGLQLGAGDRPRWKKSPTRCCRRTTASAGAARPTRRRQAGGTSGARVRVRPDHGVPDSRRAVREVEPAVRRADGGAVRALRRAARDPAARPEQRRLLPDRPDDAGRARGEERDPDLRVRGAQPRGGRVGLRRRGHGGERAPAPDRDDLARVHPRLRAARDRDAARRRTAGIRSARA